MKWLCLVIAVRTLRSRNIFAARSRDKPRVADTSFALLFFVIVLVMILLVIFTNTVAALFCTLRLIHGGNRRKPQGFFDRFFLLRREFLLRHLERSFNLNSRLVRCVVMLQPKADCRPIFVADERENLRFAQITDEHPAVLDRFFYLFCEFGIFELPAVESLSRYARLLTGRLDNRHSLELVQEFTLDRKR